ncbi:hypothetical protein HAX54_050299 [Datura stramonium]|uniref:Uncharacterized protein n=1 Tax=Datura stramonium TaxID=4076 RepID=A0ABS8WNJ3_DATST|nr:hypothetical protein [Datura stramonium]
MIELIEVACWYFNLKDGIEVGIFGNDGIGGMVNLGIVGIDGIGGIDPILGIDGMFGIFGIFGMPGIVGKLGLLVCNRLRPASDFPLSAEEIIATMNMQVFLIRIKFHKDTPIKLHPQAYTIAG